jgi:hypothetical protein
VIQPPLPIGDQLKVVNHHTVQPRRPTSRISQPRPIKVVLAAHLPSPCPDEIA